MTAPGAARPMLLDALDTNAGLGLLEAEAEQAVEHLRRDVGGFGCGVPALTVGPATAPPPVADPAPRGYGTGGEIEVKLVVAEKPSVARDLARVLGARTKQRGAWSGEGWVVTWCIGHLVELQEPEAYDSSWKRWSLATLPMLPTAFALRPVNKTLKQWRVVRDLLKQRRFEAVVNACDAGREGELIFRYVYALAKSRLPIERLWISSLTAEAIVGGFRTLKPGAAYDGLAAAARCRSEADWLVGLNATRAMTLAHDGGLYSIGRVQTPTLALVVARELEIRAFEPQPFWELSAKAEQGFVAKWRAPDGTSRLGNGDLVATLEARVRAALPLEVTLVTAKKVREAPPQLFDLTSLQRTANTRLGFSASRSLKLLQALYEKHKAITYPRTSSRYLASDQRATLPRLVDAFVAHPRFGPHASRLSGKPLPITRRTVDDGKVTDHHAIIPTGKLPKLAGDEAKMFDLVARRFLAAFHPDAELRATEAVLATGPSQRKPKGWRGDIATVLAPPPDHFVARGRVTVAAGWHAVEPPRAGAEQPLPALRVGDRVAATVRILQGKTKPPPRHTDASLLGMMETAGRRVEDEALRDAMKECGLGTPATRASIIETLIRRDYVGREGKSLVARDKGLALIQALPDPTLRSAELTGAWEARLQRIADGSDAADAFMTDVRRLVVDTVSTLTKSPASSGPSESVGLCPRCRAEVVERRSAFSCTACHFAVPRRLAGRELSSSEVVDLLKRGKTGVLSGFRSKKKRRFRAALRLEDGEVRFTFPGKRTAPARARARASAPADDPLVALTCPACQRRGMVAGRRAWGCRHWRHGCAFTVPYVIDGKKITTNELRDLLTKGKSRKATFDSGKGRLHLVEMRAALVLDPSGP